VAGLTIMVPSSLIERAGFHQSSHPGALAMEAVDPAPVRVTTMGSRGRGTVATGAIDIVTEPNTPITAPITGTVARAGNYTLYCKYRDGYVVINPDARPDLEVKLLHIQNVAVSPGDRVEAGDVIASSATTFPFRSQIDALTAEPSWPHVHIEVVDPSIPRKPSSSRC
jgi:murein DD-endopeptidase MepM/ murein hydrolase activator NlpD